MKNKAGAKKKINNPKIFCFKIEQSNFETINKYAYQTKKSIGSIFRELSENFIKESVLQNTNIKT